MIHSYKNGRDMSLSKTLFSTLIPFFWGLLLIKRCIHQYNKTFYTKRIYYRSNYYLEQLESYSKYLASLIYEYQVKRYEEVEGQKVEKTNKKKVRNLSKKISSNYKGITFLLSLFKVPYDLRLRSNNFLLKLAPILFVIFSYSSNIAFGQSAISEEIKPLKTDDPIPEELWDLSLPVTNHPEGKNYISLSEYRNKKLIILDFWATWCAPCIHSLDTLNQLDLEFTDQLKVIPITSQSSSTVLDVIKRQKWMLFSLFGDSKLSNYFPHKIVPHQIWIVDNKVFAITSHQYGNRDNIKQILSDQDIKFYTKKDGKSLDDDIISILNDENTWYKSSFGLYEAGKATSFAIRDNLILCRNMCLTNLFKSAYRTSLNLTGSDAIIWDLSPEIFKKLVSDRKIRDGKYENDKLYDEWAKDFYYSYALSFKDSVSKDRMYTIFREDLNRFFGQKYGITGTIEKRVKEVISLQLGKAEKLEVQSDQNGEKSDIVNGYKLLEILRKNFPNNPILIKDKSIYKMTFNKKDINTSNLLKLKNALKKSDVQCDLENFDMPFLLIKQS